MIEPNEFIEIIRSTNEELMSLIYTQGGCYKFHEILKAVYPSAKPYAVDYEREGIPDFFISHVVSKIGNKFYDINGRFVLDPEKTNYSKMLKMDENDIKEAKEFKYTT